MRKWIVVFTSLAVVSTSTLAQVVPENCRPVFPLADELAQVQQPDVVADRALPAVAEQASRGIFGLPLLPFLLGGGGLAALGLGGGGDDAQEALSVA